MFTAFPKAPPGTRQALHNVAKATTVAPVKKTSFPDRARARMLQAMRVSISDFRNSNTGRPRTVTGKSTTKRPRDEWYLRAHHKQQPFHPISLAFHLPVIYAQPRSQWHRDGRMPFISNTNTSMSSAIFSCNQIKKGVVHTSGEPHPPVLSSSPVLQPCPPTLSSHPILQPCPPAP